MLQLKHLGLLPRLFYNTALKQHRALELPKLLRKKSTAPKLKCCNRQMSPSLEPFCFATSNLLFGVRNWKSYNSVATARFDRNGKTQPTVKHLYNCGNVWGRMNLLQPILVMGDRNLKTRLQRFDMRFRTSCSSVASHSFWWFWCLGWRFPIPLRFLKIQNMSLKV